MWFDEIKKEEIKKVATYDREFVSKHNNFRVFDFYLTVNFPKDIEEGFPARAILKWNGSIEVYPEGFGALSSSSKELTLNIDYLRKEDVPEGGGGMDSYDKKEFIFTGDFKDIGSGNPDEVIVDLDFSDYDNPKIKKVRVEYEGRFNQSWEEKK